MGHAPKLGTGTDTADSILRERRALRGPQAVGEKPDLSTANWARVRAFPEVRAGGFSRLDGTLDFYSRVRAIAASARTILDYGAGRGEWMESQAYVDGLRDLRGAGRRVVGVDIDDTVHRNPALDQSFTVGVADKLPLADGSIDLVIADWVLEHVTDPSTVVDEVERVLKPGGWFCARTPYAYGIVGILARMVPNRFHANAVELAQPGRKEADVFPTTYRMNTRRAVGRALSSETWEVSVYTRHTEPGYTHAKPLLWIMWRVCATILPESLGQTLFVFARKRTTCD